MKFWSWCTGNNAVEGEATRKEGDNNNGDGRSSATSQRSGGGGDDGEGEAKVGQATASVYYDARQSEYSPDDENGFNPLILEKDVSLDRPESVLERPEDEPAKPKAPSSKKRRQSRYLLARTLTFRRRLEVTPKVVDTPSGYPGHLTSSQLDACLEFRRRLRDGTGPNSQVYRDMISCFADVEEEPYAICRYMRARKFDVDATIQMMDKNVELWNTGAVHDFYPNVSDGIGGAPESAFLTQFPLVVGREARNGCPIIYFSVRDLKIEGLECLTPMDDIPNYFWHLAVHKMKRHINDALTEDPDKFVRTQIMVVVDLKNLAMSTLKSAMGALKGAFGVLGVFPEFLFNTVIINVPRFFASFWPIIKGFVDAETAKKFELYSNPTRGTERLMDLIGAADLASDFGGKAESTHALVAQQGSDPESGKVVDRQVYDLLTVHRNKEVVSCLIELKANETASVTVHTKGVDGSKASLHRAGGGGEPIEVIPITRGKERAADGAFFVEVTSPLQGPGKYDMRIGRKSNGPSVEHFLVLANICRS